MATGFVGRTKAFALKMNTPRMICSSNQFRKGIVIANHDADPVLIAFGLTPAPEDFFQIGETESITFDEIVPVGPVWARGGGHVVVIDSSDAATPFDPKSLFTPGREGFWLDMHDLTTLFADATASTPAVIDGPVMHIKDKSGNGVHFTLIPGLEPAILRQVGYRTFLEFKGKSAYTCSQKFEWLTDPYIDKNGGLLAVGMTPNGVLDTWNPILGNNAGSGNNMGFYIAQEMRSQYTPETLRTYANSGSYLSPGKSLPSNQPAVASITTGRIGDDRIIHRTDLNGAIVTSTDWQMRRPQSVTTVALGATTGTSTPTTTMFYGLFHGAILTQANLAGERENIHLYLGADAGAPIA